MAHPKGARFKAWQTYLLSKAGASERHPFDPELPVYFVKKKLFAIYGADKDGEWLNLKCWPDWSLDLRREHKGITPGYHMNKKHWNTLELRVLPRPLVKRLIDHSYDLVSGRIKSALAKEARQVRPKAL